MLDAVLNDPKLPTYVAMGGTAFVILFIAEVARRYRKEAKRLQTFIDASFKLESEEIEEIAKAPFPHLVPLPGDKRSLSKVLSELPDHAFPQSTPEELHRKYEGMAEQDHSPTTGPWVAGKLKYLEQVRWHGKQ